MKLSNLIKKKQRVLLASALALAVCSSSFLWFSPKTELIGKDFAVAEKQYTQMLTTAKDLKLFPRTTNPDGSVKYTDVHDWTGGFFPGGLWYLYEYTGDAKWKAAAEQWTAALEEGKYNTVHHDVGFVMYCSYGNGLRLTNNPAYKDILIQSAESLCSRYDAKVGAIKSWNPKMSWDKKTMWKYPVIIDNMMNLELLFYASKVTGNPKYKDIAVSHALNAMRDHVRKDYSSYHVINYDAETGKVLNSQTNQGYSDNSTWARGQAWGIYGFTMVYRETKDKRFLETARKMADFYLKNSNLPKDKIPYWDFNVNQKGYQPDWNYDASKFAVVPRDVSAASVATSALFELSTYLGKDGKTYYQQAEQMINSLSKAPYLAEPGTNAGFILKHSVGSLPHTSEIDVPLIYADYYFLEALLRYKKLKG